jgi:hypothetical protein
MVTVRSVKNMVCLKKGKGQQTGLDHHLVVSKNKINDGSSPAWSSR